MGLPRVIGASAVVAMLVVGTASTPAHSQSTTPSQNQYYFSGVSCVAANDCFAVGQAVLGDHERPPLIARWDGTRWPIVPSPTPTGKLFAISCVSGTCMAVGDHKTSGGDRTLVERWNGSSWSVIPSADVGNNVSDWLTGVACPRANECTAVGMVEGAGQPLVERWNGVHWVIDSIPRPLGNKGLTAVACAAPQSCFAVGAQSTSPSHALIEHWNGGQWSPQTVSDPPASVRSFLDGVTCTDTSSCIAVGTYTNNGANTLVEHWNGRSWARQLSANYPCCNPSTGRLHSVACPTSASCMAVGDAFAYALTVHRVNGSWVYQPSPQPNNVQFSGVTCWSAANCVAVGTNFADVPFTRAEHWDGKRWTIQPSP